MPNKTLIIGVGSIGVIAIVFIVLILVCNQRGEVNAEEKISSEIESVASTKYDDQYNQYIYNDIPAFTWNDIVRMDSKEKRTFYLTLTNSLTDIWETMDVDASSYAVEDTIPSLPIEDLAYLHYIQKVNGYSVDVDFKRAYEDLKYGRAILHFAKPNHSFQVYCDMYYEEQLENPKAGEHIYLNYTSPKDGEYLSDKSPFYFKDMDYDGEEELVVNNIGMGARGYNTYDVYKVYNVEKPLCLKGRPFVDGLYKITNYNVGYEPETKCVLDKRYDGMTAYGHYRYQSVPSNTDSVLNRVFLLKDAEDRGFYHLKNTNASDSINLLQPYKKYDRENGKLVLTESGIYEQGNYGRNYNEVVLN